MSGPILLGVVGVFVLCQVLGGDALGRLGIAGTSQASPAAPATPAPVPASGPGMVPGPGQPMPHGKGF